MPNLDDEKFENYLKGFRPLTPEVLPVPRGRSSPRLGVRICSVAVGVLLVLAGVVLLRPTAAVKDAVTRLKTRSEVTTPPPLTVRSANALLTEAPSLKEAIDNMAFHQSTTPLPAEQQSAMAVLRKERFKL